MHTARPQCKRRVLVLSLGLFPLTIQANELDSLRSGEKLEELTVTATKTTRLKRELPMSISVLSKPLLDQTGFQGIRDINAHIPNVYIPDFGSARSTPIFIRGIGSRRVNMIGFYSDGVPLLDGESIDSDYSDARSIEVLRGPQGSLYGRGAMGGLINITSYRPLDHQGSHLELTAGNYGRYGLSGQSYQALNERWGVSASVNYQERGGYFTNQHTGERVDGSSAYASKFAVQYRAKGWETYLYAQYQRRKQGAYPYGLVQGGRVLPVSLNDESSYKRDLVTIGLSLQKYWASSGLRLKSGTSFQYLKDNMLMDQDFTSRPAITAELSTRRKTVTEDLNLSQRIGRYSWVTGIYGFWIDSERAADNRIKMLPMMHTTSLLSYDEPNYAVAIYHQSAYDITPKLTAELGLRYDWEWSKQDYTSTTINHRVATPPRSVSLPYSTIYRQFTPKLSLTYRLEQEHRIYASVLRGYQSGGFNLQFDFPSEQSYLPEYSWNYELGTHLYIDRKVEIDAALFYIDWEQQQVQQAVLSALGSKITNAGRSRSLGAELSVDYRPIKQLSLSLAYGYTKATFRTYDEYNAATASNVSRSGNYLPQVPKQTLAVRLDYTLPIRSNWLTGIKLGAQYRGLGSIYWSTDNLQKQSYYQTIDAQLRFIGKGCNLDFWVRNLTNTEYSSFQFVLQGLNFAQRGTPRHIGATLSVDL